MTLDIMPWYLGMEEGTDLDEPELYWINVHNTSLSKLFEEIDEDFDKITKALEGLKKDNLIKFKKNNIIEINSN